MPKMGRAWLMLVLTAAWVGACSGQSRSDRRAAAGASAGESTAGNAVSESAGGDDALIAGGAERAAVGGSRASGGAGGSRISGGSGGSIVASSGIGGTGGSTDTRNIFIDQVVQGAGGGPPRCLPRSLPVDASGKPVCFIAEFKHGSCDCDQPGRSALSPASALQSLTKYLQNSGICDGTSGVSCDSLCACDISQLESDDLKSCQNDVVPAETVNGYCVVDLMHTDENSAPAPIGNPALVAQCPSNEKRLLRFVGSGEPAHDATVLLGCWQ